MRDKNSQNQPGLKSFFWKIPGDVPGYRSETDPYQGVRETRNLHYQGSMQTDTHSNASAYRKPINWIVLLMVLLLVCGVGIIGYRHYVIPPAAVTTSTKQPKVFELTLGKQNSTSQSKVRIITHVVVKGDTLWDIAKKYVKDPFRYPELAKLSKIKNPDLIYPYDLVRIRIYEQ